MKPMTKYEIIAFVTLLLLIGCVFKASAADVTLNITVPDAWVSDAIATVNSKFPGREEAGMTNKQWTEYQISQWLKGMIVDYRNRTSKETILAAQGYTEITEDDVQIDISQ